MFIGNFSVLFPETLWDSDSQRLCDLVIVHITFYSAQDSYDLYTKKWITINDVRAKEKKIYAIAEMI